MLLADLPSLSIQEVYYRYRNNINAIDVIQVTPDLLGRLDILITEYFAPYFELENEGNDFVDVFPYYQILLDFNGIMDINDVQIGDIIIVPDLSTIVEYIERNTVFEDDTVAGVSDIRVTSKAPELFNTHGTVTKTTTGIVKLGIKQRSVNFDSKTGKIIF